VYVKYKVMRGGARRNLTSDVISTEWLGSSVARNAARVSHPRSTRGGRGHIWFRCSPSLVICRTLAMSEQSLVIVTSMIPLTRLMRSLHTNCVSTGKPLHWRPGTYLISYTCTTAHDAHCNMTSSLFYLPDRTLRRWFRPAP
jgi:hypothetical protein